MARSVPTGIEVRHEKKCATRKRQGARCSCTKSYRGGVWNAERKANDWSPWGPSLKEAQTWQAKAKLERAAGRRRKTGGPTLKEAVEGFLTDAEAGIARDRKGKVYKPSTLRSYRRAWERHVEPYGLGPHRLTAIGRADWQAFIDHLAREGHEGKPLAGSTIRNVLNPVKVAYRRAIQRGEADINPTKDLDLPAADGKRERFATPDEVRRLLAALPDTERAIWGTAVYAGLRRGELRALRWNAVDLEGSMIEVRASWDDDPAVGEIEVKSDAGRRRVPIIAALKAMLRMHKEETGRGGTDLVFGAEADRPFMPSTVRNRALAAWSAANKAGAEADEAWEPLVPIGLHECRHTFASLMIAAGINAKTLSTLMGHASIAITFDRYGKLMPGAEAEAGVLLDTFVDAVRAA